ncbi:MAG: helix-turn-helix domain-containing protein [Chloroflexota bacterium]
MPKLGEMLRAARQDQGVSLAEAEQATKIRRKFLVALEEEDFSSLPETVYVLGYLRQYASFLRLDPDLTARVFKEQSGRRDLPGVQPETRIIRDATRRSAVSPSGLSGLLIVVGVVLLLIYGYQQYLQIQEAVQPPVASLSPLPTAAAAPTQAATPAAVAATSPTATSAPSPTATVATGVTIDLRIVSDRCWVRVIADDQVLTKNDQQGEILNPGETRTWNAQRYLHIRVGNAGAADITFNGIHEGMLGPIGAVREKEWRASTVR